MTLSPLHLVVNWPVFTIYMKYNCSTACHWNLLSCLSPVHTSNNIEVRHCCWCEQGLTAQNVSITRGGWQYISVQQVRQIQQNSASSSVQSLMTTKIYL